jgi:cytoskeletal protein RodZ
MVLVIAALLLAFFIFIALVATRRKDAADAITAKTQVPSEATTTKSSTKSKNNKDTNNKDTNKLPVGADAALWSIVEAVPDPRNHLALTRDLTGEVRITGTILDPSFQTNTPPVRTQSAVKPATPGAGSVRIIAERIQPSEPLAQDGDSLGRAS